MQVFGAMLSVGVESAGGHHPETLVSYEKVQNIKDFITSRVSVSCEIGIVCGSGLSALADEIEDPLVLPYSSIPEFPLSTIEGHKSQFVFGKIRGKVVVCMQGRFHFYEGHSMANATIGIRVMKALGVKTVIITNASGGLNPNFKGGDIMIINDHINFPGLAGFNPLRGPNDERFGVRFPSVSDLYDPLLHVLVREVAKEEGVEGIQEGTYCFVSGPSYETPAECHLLRKLGGDAVGMSTVPECIVAHHCGIKVIGLSLVTNMVTFEKHSDSHVSHEEVLATGVARAEAMKTLVSGLIGKI